MSKTSSPRDQQIITRILRLPRPLRILLASVPAVALVALLQPMVDLIYLQLFFNESTVQVPSWILAAFGFAMYFAGWVFLVGLPGDDMAQRRGAVWYLSLSILIIAILMMYYAAQIFVNIEAFSG